MNFCVAPPGTRNLRPYLLLESSAHSFVVIGGAYLEYMGSIPTPQTSAKYDRILINVIILGVFRVEKCVILLYQKLICVVM